MAQATKAQLAEALEAAQLRIQELETAQAAAAAPAEAPAPAEQPVSRAHLSQALWLQRKPLSQQGEDGKGNIGYTRAGTLVVRFGAQYASLNRESGQRVFGPWKFFTAYGEIAQSIISFMAGEDRLAVIEAYEEPWASQSNPNDRQSDWVVRGFSPISRSAGSAPAERQPAPAPRRVTPAAPAAQAPAQAPAAAPVAAQAQLW